MWAIRQRFRSLRVILPAGTKLGVRFEEINRYTKKWRGGRVRGRALCSLTLGFGLDQVQHLAQQVLEGQGLDAHPFHPLALLLVEVLQLKHGQDAVSVRVHAAEPVLDAEEGRGSRERRWGLISSTAGYLSRTRSGRGT